jgi:nitroreductase
MPTSVSSATATALRRAAVRATLAPSVHNTQPWRMRLAEGRLDIYADLSRQLPVLDPTSRQLVISCGCALMNARVALAGGGCGVQVQRFGQPSRTTPIAALTLTAEPPDLALAALDPVLELRQTNRRQFAEGEIAESLMGILEQAAAAEGALLFTVRDPEQRMTVATLSQRADAIENLNPAYRAELRAWTSDDPGRRDGVPSRAVPHVDGSSEDDVPIRDFDTRGAGGLPSRTRSSIRQTMVLLCTDSDMPASWLRAGEALERVLLEITRHGLSASLLTQVTEGPSTRAELRHELKLAAHPHVLLRIGRAPITPASRRRRLVEVLTEED